METAIQQLIEKCNKEIKLLKEFLSDLTAALPVEREQIEDAYGDGLNAHRTNFCNRNEYFNQTFKQVNS